MRGEENNILVEADNPKAFAIGVKSALNKDGRKALEDVKRYTWNKRAEKIVEFVEDN